MDPGQSVPADVVERILEATAWPHVQRLAALRNCHGDQPGRAQRIKHRLEPGANHRWLAPAGVCRVGRYTAERINHMFDLTNTVRGFNNEGWENYRQMLLSSYPQRDPEVNFQHAARQACIGLSAALMAAAFEGVDSTPMEGFDPKALDDILGLRARGLRSVAIMPLGYRLADKDWLVNLPKVRRPRSEFVTEV